MVWKCCVAVEPSFSVYAWKGVLAVPLLVVFAALAPKPPVVPLPKPPVVLLVEPNPPPPPNRPPPVVVVDPAPNAGLLAPPKRLVPVVAPPPNPEEVLLVDPKPPPLPNVEPVFEPPPKRPPPVDPEPNVLEPKVVLGALLFAPKPPAGDVSIGRPSANDRQWARNRLKYTRNDEGSAR